MMRHEAEKATPVTGGGLIYWIQMLLGLLFAVAGLALFIEAQSFNPMRPGTSVGPGLLPTICAVVFMVFGPALIINTFSERKKILDIKLDDYGSFRFILVVVLGLVATIVLIPILGFIITCSLYSLLIAWSAGAPWWGAAINGGSVAVFVYFLFTELLRVVLPAGLVF